MIVKTTIRDMGTIKNDMKRMFIMLGIYFAIFIGSILTIGILDNLIPKWMIYTCVVIFLLCVILVIPMFIWIIVKANKLYKASFVEKNIDYTALAGNIYVNGKKMHVNYDKQFNEIYVHDIEEENSCSVSFYGTIKGDGAGSFLKYLNENNVEIEKEDNAEIEKENNVEFEKENNVEFEKENNVEFEKENNVEFEKEDNAEIEKRK